MYPFSILQVSPFVAGSGVSIHQKSNEQTIKSFKWNLVIIKKNKKIINKEGG